MAIRAISTPRPTAAIISVASASLSGDTSSLATITDGRAEIEFYERRQLFGGARTGSFIGLDKQRLVLVDEVKTGFGVAKGGVQEPFGIKADLCTFAKAIASGVRSP